MISCTGRVKSENVLCRGKEERNTLHITKRRKAELMGFTMRSNCLRTGRRKGSREEKPRTMT